MILLTEVAEIEEFYRLCLLFESKGVLVHKGNQDSARNFGVFHPVGKYAIYVVLDEQIDDAQALLLDESHVVQNAVDIQEYQRHAQAQSKSINNKILVAMLAICSLLISLLVFFF